MASTQTNQSNQYYQILKPVLENKFIKSKIFRSYSPYIFSVITITLLIYFALRPTITTVLVLRKDIQTHEETLGKLKEKAKNITLAKQRLTAIDTTTKNKILTAVPKEPDVTSIIRHLKGSFPAQASASAVVQVQPLSLTVKELSAVPLLKTAPYTFNNEGTFTIFLSLLSNLRTAPRAFSLDSVSISKPQEGNTIMTINGKAFYIQ